MRKVDRTLFHYSVSIYLERREVLYGIRGFSMAAQRTINNKIPWAGATEDRWKAARHIAKFYFTSEVFRGQFLEWINELVKEGSFQVLDLQANDPAPESNEE